MLTKPKVTVYPPNGGQAEKHSPANARDLVNGAKYSWHPQVKASPVQSAPFARVAPPPGTKEPAQAVLDRAGGQAPQAAPVANAPLVDLGDQAVGLEADDAIDIEAGVGAEPEVVVAAEPEAEEAAAEDVADEDAEEAPAPRRGRGSRKAD